VVGGGIEHCGTASPRQGTRTFALQRITVRKARGHHAICPVGIAELVGDVEYQWGPAPPSVEGLRADLVTLEVVLAGPTNFWTLIMRKPRFWRGQVVNPIIRRVISFKYARRVSPSTSAINGCMTATLIALDSIAACKRASSPASVPSNAA